MNTICKDLKIGFIGAGKVGFTFGKFLSERNIRVTGYYSRHAESAKEAANFTGTKCFEKIEELVVNCDAIFLTVPDGVITTVFQSIKDLDISGKFICHMSGALSSKEAFPLIEETGATGYSIHPLFPISSKYESYKELSDAFFCLEGDESGINIFKELLERFSIKTRIISCENKIKYHAACAVASNLICGIVSQSINMLIQCGFSEDEALVAISPLMKSNMQHIIEDGPVKALTGPIERNDVNTVKKHLTCFDSNDIKVYKSVSKAVLECAKLKNPNNDYEILESILSM